MPEGTSPTQKNEPELLLKLEKTIYDMAKNRALASGATRVRPDEIEPLVESAKAMARNEHREPFDPARYPADAERKRRHQQALTRRPELEERLVNAEAARREAAADVAAIPPPGPEPRINRWHLIPAISLVALSVLPIIRDKVADVADAALGWFFALIGGVVVGLTVAMPIACTLGQTGERTKAAFGALFWGGFVAASILFLRVAGADDWSECLGAAALAMLELAAVAGLEFVAKRLRPQHAAWFDRKERHELAAGALKASDENVRCRLEDLDSCQRDIDDYLQYVDERTLRNLTTSQLEEAAERAARDGYAAGLAENRGRLLGARRRP